MKRVLGMAFVLAACGTTSKPGRMNLVSPPVVSDDTQDLYNANVVVNLTTSSRGVTDFCTGVLLSRTRVLTASHCVIGPPMQSAGPSPSVSVGSVPFNTTQGIVVQTMSPPDSPLSELGHNTDPTNPSDVGADLAIVALDESALDEDVRRIVGDSGIAGRMNDPDLLPNLDLATMVDDSPFGTLLVLNVQRPIFGKWSGGAAAFASWRGLERSRHDLDIEGDLDGDYFAIAGTGAAMGDSGSPLFATRGDGSRDTLAILSGGAGNSDAYFVNLSSDRSATFIQAQMIDHTHDTQPRWRLMHPAINGGDWWTGEDEYSGACNPTFDSDCDHWTDTHDNCVSIFNHDQKDTDDDGIGNACD